MNNIYLIGFTDSGKKEVASKLQKFLPLQILNLNDAIERVEVMSLSEILSKKGEEALRAAESQLLSIISRENNQIIVCDEGIVSRKDNIDIMTATGTLIGADDSFDIAIDINNLNEDEMASEIVKQLALTGRLN